MKIFSTLVKKKKIEMIKIHTENNSTVEMILQGRTSEKRGKARL